MCHFCNLVVGAKPQHLTWLIQINRKQSRIANILDRLGQFCSFLLLGVAYLTIHQEWLLYHGFVLNTIEKMLNMLNNLLWWYLIWLTLRGNSAHLLKVALLRTKWIWQETHLSIFTEHEVIEHCIFSCQREWVISGTSCILSHLLI